MRTAVEALTGRETRRDGNAASTSDGKRNFRNIAVGVAYFEPVAV